MSDDLDLKIPSEVVELLGLSREELEARNRLLLAMELYQQEKATLSLAAGLANLKIDQFLEEFHKRRLLRRGGPESNEEAEKDFQNALKYSK